MRHAPPGRVMRIGIVVTHAAALTPATGAFDNSTATVTSATYGTSGDVVPASTTASVKLAWSRR